MLPRADRASIRSCHVVTDAMTATMMLADFRPERMRDATIRAKDPLLIFRVHACVSLHRAFIIYIYYILRFIEESYDFF